jgi:hypothetical protein
MIIAFEQHLCETSFCVLTLITFEAVFDNLSNGNLLEERRLRCVIIKLQILFPDGSVLSLVIYKSASDSDN